MSFVRNYFKFLVLSLTITLIPLVLLCIAGVVDSAYDEKSFVVVVVRYLLVPLVLATLVYLTLASVRNRDFEESIAIHSRDLRWTVGAIATSAVLLLLMFWPLTNWSTYLFGGSGDGYNWRWQIWRMGQEFRQWRVFPSHFDDVIAPYGVDLRLNDGYLSMYIGGIWNLLCNPTLAYNLTVATSVIANFFSARHLSLTLYKSQLTSLIAGCAMATAPSLTLRQMGHLNLCFTFVLCLAVVEGVKLIRNKKVRIWQPSLVLILAFFSSFYFFVLSGMFYFACVLVHFARLQNQRRTHKRFLIRISMVALIIGIVVSPFVLARLHHDTAERIAGAPAASARTDEYMYYSADPRTFFIPASDARLPIPRVAQIRSGTSPNTVENTPFPGYIPLLAVALLILLVARWRWFVLSLWSIFTVLALGPTLIWGADSRFAFFFPHAIVESAKSEPVTWLPYGTITAIPGLSALRTPNRFAMILPVIGIMALAILLSEYSSKNRGLLFRSTVLIGALALLVPNLRNNNYWFNTKFESSVAHALDIIRRDSSNLRVLIAGESCLQTISMANLQIEHRHPMIGCQTFSAAVPWYSGLKSYRESSSLSAVQCDPNSFGLAPMSPQNVPIEIDRVLPNLKATLRVGYIVLPKRFACQDPSRTQIIVDTLKTGSTVLVDSDDYLIVSI